MRRLAAALVFLCALTRPVMSLDLPEIKERGRLLVIVAGDPASSGVEARFMARQGNDLVGIEGEILAGFARQQKLELEAVYVPRKGETSGRSAGRGWEMLIPSLLNRKGDLIAGDMTATAARRKLIDFTVETFPTRDVVITRKPHRVIQTVEQLREEQVGVAAGTSYVETLRAAGVPPKNLGSSKRRPPFRN